MADFVNDSYKQPIIKVISVGNGGGNILQKMMDTNIEGVEFVCANTDINSQRTQLIHCQCYVSCVSLKTTRRQATLTVQ